MTSSTKRAMVTLCTLSINRCILSGKKLMSYTCRKAKGSETEMPNMVIIHADHAMITLTGVLIFQTMKQKVHNQKHEDKQVEVNWLY